MTATTVPHPDESIVQPHVRIRPTRGWATIDLPELWRYRELLFLLAWRDVTVRYKQTILGVIWVVLEPLMTVMIFHVLFSVMIPRPSIPTIPNVPYILSSFCAMVPWQLFAKTINAASNSLVANRNLITKVYFPRLIAPLTPVLSSLVDFLVLLVILVAMIIGFDAMSEWFTFVWSPRLLMLPVFTLIAILAATAMSMWLAAANAIYRDVRFIVPSLVNIMMYGSAVLYTSQSFFKHGFPDWVVWLFHLNPMAGVCEGFRWALFPTYDQPPGAMMIPSTLMVIALLVGGLYYFRRMERTFADVA
jgi:lipopolysaccharide transport system permease protein